MKPWKFWMFLIIQTVVQTVFACVLFLILVGNQGSTEPTKKTAADGTECIVYRSSIHCNYDQQNVWTKFNNFPFVGDDFGNETFDDGE